MASISGLRSQTPSSTTTSPAGLILGRVVEVGSTRPISGVVVTMADPACRDRDRASRPRQVLTNAQGRFVFRQVPKGSYTLTATIGGNGLHAQRVHCHRPGFSDRRVPQRRLRPAAPRWSVADDRSRPTDSASAMSMIGLWKGALDLRHLSATKRASRWWVWWSARCAWRAMGDC